MLSFEEFDQIIGSVKRKDQEFEVIWNALGDCDKLYQTSMFSEVLVLLKHIFRDKNEWIAYWVWEFNFGEKWHEGCVTETDGTDIKLQTSADLYQFLINNIAQQEDKD